MSTEELGLGFVKKGSNVVMAKHFGDVKLQGGDQTLFNYLLMRAYNEIVPGAVHQIPIRDLMDYGRFDRIAHLQDAIERLCRSQIEIDYKEPNGETRSIFSHFLSGDISKSENGFLKFAFDPILILFLMHPKVYALISIKRNRDIKGFESERLYEAMQLQYNKKTPVWRASVEEIREFFCVGAKHVRFDNLRRYIIEKAIRDVNAIAEFDVVPSYITGGHGGTVVEVEFTAISKSHSRMIEARAVKSAGKARSRRKNKDEHTIDMLDGQTRDEREGPATVLPETIEMARKMIGPDDDIGVLMSEWRKKIRGWEMLDPDANFIAWLGMRKQQAEDVLLKDVDDDVFGTLLNEGQ
jgi:hypothetical protein